MPQSEHIEPELMRTDPFAEREQNSSQVHTYAQHSFQDPGEGYTHEKKMEAERRCSLKVTLCAEQGLSHS